MLTQDEKDYLNNISVSKKVHIKSFDPKAKETGDLIVKRIKKKLPHARVLFMGATALEIAGQNDIDICVLAKQKAFDKYLPTLKKLFGKPIHAHKTFVEWKFEENSYPVKLYLTEPPERQIKVFEILKSNKKLLKKYEDLKLKFNGKSFRDYQRAKYEFYHQVSSSAYHEVSSSAYHEVSSSAYNKILGKELVRKGYDKIANKYLSARDQYKNLKYLEKLNSLLKPNSTILDIGCGSGKPIDKFLSNKGHQIIGIDISEKQIELARKNIPQGKFEIRDLTDLKSKEYKVDAVVSFYTIFHIPREKHQKLLKTINSFLPKDGLLLITMGTSKWEGVEDFFSTKMYWSHYGPKKNRKIIENAGFEIILDEIDTSGGERHQIILARKRNEATQAKNFLGKEVEVIMDRPLGSKHPKHGFLYDANYGYIPNTKSPDGEELDAYYLGINKPIKRAKGVCIAIIHRTNDNDDKLVVVPNGANLTNEEIEKQTKFQEQWFKHIIIRK